ncbi:agamous-like MADS-box protein AGL65 isoform X2 [Phalaenopsis equestris]|uniref:agamous-like MADS-box protein AGL65 isoform X2 n=1 Tax=Phalaenopsis equestris TaxID=78828 RepID=UPI0009E46A07|nr:agamous-like MADS-box protein AGL65 isoform X2 [Phalaenopsis equestris]
MGRVKLKIKKLESTSGRQVTYSKRRAGILKKSKELAILCDIDILLLMFSPTGKPTLCYGERSNIEEVLAKFVQLTPQERLKRKLECLEALKKTFKKLDHDINISDFLGSSQTVEELSDRLRSLQSQLFDAQRQLSYLTDPENVNSLEQIIYMEGVLRQALDRIEMHKRYLGNRFIPLDCVGEFHNGMYLPYDMTNEQQPSNLQWFHDDGRHFMVSGAPSFLPQRINLYSTGTSHQGYNGYFVDEMQEVYSKHRQEESFNCLGQSSSLQLQLGAQYTYHSYGMNYFGEMVQPNGDIGLHEDHADFQVNGLEPPKPVFDADLRRAGVAITGLHDRRPCA